MPPLILSNQVLIKYVAKAAVILTVIFLISFLLFAAPLILPPSHKCIFCRYARNGAVEESILVTKMLAGNVEFDTIILSIGEDRFPWISITTCPKF